MSSDTDGVEVEQALEDEAMGPSSNENTEQFAEDSDLIADDNQQSKRALSFLPCLMRIARLQKSQVDQLEMQEAVSRLDSTQITGKAMRKQMKGFSAHLGLPAPKWLSKPDPANMPVLMISAEEGFAVLRGKNAMGQWISERWDDASQQWQELADDKLEGFDFAVIKFVRGFKASESPVYDLIRNEIFAHKKILMEVILAGFVINTVALATAFYTMQVYDRVIPTGAFNTLLVLSLGAGAAVLYDLFAKYTRHKLYNRLVDAVDQRLARSTFMRFLNIRLDQMPTSVGSLASQMRGYETVRGFLTAVTGHLFVDTPFALLYAGIILLIAGWIALIPLSFFVICVIIGLASRRKIDALAKNMDAAVNLKTGLLVETVEGAESIKSGQGGWRMLSRWMSTTDDVRDYELKMRDVSEHSKNIVASFQQVSYLSLIATGALLASEGELTLGALIACSILSGRILAPVAAIPGLLVQWAHSNAALQGLDRIWSLEDDHFGQDQPIVLAKLKGNFRFEDVSSLYGERAALTIPGLSIKAGEKIAILGPVGAGKTTLLRMLSGMYKPQNGRILIDDVDMAHVAKPVLAENIGFVQQEGRLFSGTLRENLTLGLLDPGDEELLEVCRKTGLLQTVITPHPEGMQQPIFEGGTGLSGGQRQLVNLTRAFLRKPKVWLLDEPSASMDRSLEQLVIGALREAIQPEDNLFLVTHKPELLTLVDRILVVAGQKIVLDGPRDSVIAKLSENNAPNPNAGDPNTPTPNVPQPQ